MSKRLQPHAVHCTCSECVSRSINGQDIKSHPPTDAPVVSVDGEQDEPLLEVDDDDEETACAASEHDDNGPHSGAV